jgi:hypothetical protein
MKKEKGRKNQLHKLARAKRRRTRRSNTPRRVEEEAPSHDKEEIEEEEGFEVVIYG